MDLHQQLKLCTTLATEWHSGQYRRDGVTPFIVHPSRVAASCGEDKLAACVAWLHDVIEDTQATHQLLREAGVHDRIVNMVVWLTHDPQDTYDEYIDSIARGLGNKTVAKVKLLDILDNVTDAPTNKQKYYDAVLKIGGVL